MQLHWPDRYAALWGANQYRPEREYPAVAFEEQVAAIGELIAAGKIRHWGESGLCTIVHE